MKYTFYFVLCLFFVTACTSEHVDFKPSNNEVGDLYLHDGKLGETPKERMRLAILELQELTKKALLNLNVRKEFGILIKSNFYIDNVVALNDFLNFQNSLAYGYHEVPDLIKGSFANFYKEEIEKNYSNYLNLIDITDNKVFAVDFLKNLPGSSFYDNAYLSFYMPYDENEQGVYFNTTDVPVLVPAVMDADSGYAEKYVNNNWVATTSNDQTASNQYTIIINPMFDECSGLSMAPQASIASNENIPVNCDDVSSSTQTGSGSTSPSTANIYQGDCTRLDLGESFIRPVYIGRVKAHDVQYDHLISFTGNGGGSELRYCRADSQQAIDIDSLGNYTTTQWDERVSQYWSRKQIKKENVRKVSALWDINWECFGTHEQLFVIYEEDNEGDLFIDQDLEFELDSTYSARIDVKIQNRSKDDAIIMRKRERVEFFATNLLDHGCGCWDGDGSFADRCWGIYDCGADFSYTMYHRWIYVGDNSQY